MNNNKLHLAALGSLNYYSRSLGDTGRGYHLKEQSSPRCFAESGAIIDAAFDKIASNSDIDAVLITGNFTNANEAQAHQEIVQKLYELKSKKPVFVLPTDKFTEDHADRYLGTRAFNDVPVLNNSETAEFYKDFGLSSSSSSYKSSYCAEIAPGYKLLALSRFDKEHLEWAENELKEAQSKNETVIILETEPLLPHISPLNFTKNEESRTNIAEIFADNGANLIFGGFNPNQNISEYKSDGGASLYEVNIGTLPCYPAPIIHCIIDENEITLKTEYLESFNYDGKTIETQSFLKQHLTEIFTRVIKPGAHGDALEFLDRAAALGFKMKRKRFYFPVFPAVYIFSKLKIGSFYPFNTALTKEEKKLPLTDVAEKLAVKLFDSNEKLSPALSDAVKGIAHFSSRIIKLISKSEKASKQIEKLTESIVTQNDYDTKLVIKRK